MSKTATVSQLFGVTLGAGVTTVTSAVDVIETVGIATQELKANVQAWASNGEDIRKVKAVEAKLDLVDRIKSAKDRLTDAGFTSAKEASSELKNMLEDFAL